MFTGPDENCELCIKNAHNASVFVAWHDHYSKRTQELHEIEAPKPCANYAHLGHTMSVHLIVECAPANAEDGCGLLFVAVYRSEGELDQLFFDCA